MWQLKISSLLTQEKTFGPSLVSVQHSDLCQCRVNAKLHSSYFSELVAFSTALNAHLHRKVL